ncbi:MAG: tRNA (N(6)-L-threonylcarbamoyladenosine(37)-C(2))-methylthiotransferase [Candidatus Aenigmarchaeota archaeon]|nr:tRNA (N(6)-L-threonylcarbamoyladenosine(37)-C(2))-methylthiotransferase [Candidatus Aenigmarchaeota archaeon]
MVKVYGEFYGCSANKADHEIMLGLLKKSGFKTVGSPKEADINLITTCAVKSPTVARMIFRSRELTKVNRPLIVAGCLSKIDKERKLVEKINPKASFIGPDAITDIVDVAYATLNGEKVLSLERLNEEKVSLPHLRTTPIIDIVEISSGCISNCSFCATKLARGDLHSYRPHAIREQIKDGIKDGCKEFWLASQDSSAYGRDIDTSLPELLESVTRLEGRFFIRVGMMNPLHFKKVEIRDLIEAFKNEKIYKFLHLCVQSGSNKVLKIMRRGYTVEGFISYVELFRKEIPELALATDIIVGHPGEEDVDFEKTIQLIEKIRPDIVNISKFGKRPGTHAEKMIEVPRTVVDERSRELSKLVRKISYERNKKWVGWKGKVLVNIKNNGTMIGSNYAYKPVLINGPVKLGEFLDIRITGAKRNLLIGECL